METLSFEMTTTRETREAFIDFICPNCGRLDEDITEVVDENELRYYLQHPKSQVCLKCQLFPDSTRDAD